MKRLLFFIIIVLAPQILAAQPDDPLIFPFEKKYGQVEVGGPYVGVEFHNSRPLPSRISFYYPVANSIDLSTDYWKRGDSRPMALGVKINSEKKKWIGREAWRYILSPHAVTFLDEDMVLAYELKYEFCYNAPAMVVTLKIRNRTEQRQSVSVFSQLALSLRTCQTYARFDSAAVTYDPVRQSITAQFQAPETRNAALFVVNAGERAAGVWTDAAAMQMTDDGKSLWQDSAVAPSAGTQPGPAVHRGGAMFEYVKEFQPGEVMTIVQLIGSAGANESGAVIADLSAQWRKDADRYDHAVRSAASTDSYFRTNNARVDRTLQWSKALLTTNAHSINGQIVPMPCPAEYNFFFTHDLLMTDLGAVNYDLPRVKKDLDYVASLAKDSIIPHAYYWKDDGFKTEFCTPSNWNHLWFIEVSASYLRHSLDSSTLRRIYPLVSKSLTEVMTQLRSDHLMHAYRPDWWDLGWKEGPRTYITALSIRAIEDYLFIASMIDPGNRALPGLEQKANAMRKALIATLWDDSLNYLINYNGPDKDSHRYMGSLIAPAYGLLDGSKTERMLATVSAELLAQDLGIRAVMPSDFHNDSVIKYFNIAGLEAGDAYTYINGGVWPHNNAWYALALQSGGRSNDALAFVKKYMTIDGIAESPNGVPAMYEYRYSNPSSPRYGEIDKPSFLWAGGFYLYTMYALAGLTDNVWNLSVAESRAAFDSTVRCSYSFISMKDVVIGGTGARLSRFLADGKNVPSIVLPLNQRTADQYEFQFGAMSNPYVNSVNAIVRSVEYSASKKSLHCTVSSFKGHSTTMQVTGLKAPRRVTVNGKEVKGSVSTKNTDGTIRTVLSFTAGRSADVVSVQW
jgi:hypothetical protein